MKELKDEFSCPRLSIYPSIADLGSLVLPLPDKNELALIHHVLIINTYKGLRNGALKVLDTVLLSTKLTQEGLGIPKPKRLQLVAHHEIIWVQSGKECAQAECELRHHGGIGILIRCVFTGYDIRE